MFYDWCVLLIFPFSLIFAGISDAMSFTIPNRVSLVLFIGFLILAPISGMSISEIGMNVLVGFLALLVGFALFARGIIGGGDAKLIAAASLWFGVELIGPFLLMTAVFGGLLSLICMKMHSTPLPYSLAGQKWLLNFQSGTAAVPYGVAIGLAGLSVYPYSHWLGLS